jgi:hypothetical protein
VDHLSKQASTAIQRKIGHDAKQPTAVSEIPSVVACARLVQHIWESSSCTLCSTFQGLSVVQSSSAGPDRSANPPILSAAHTSPSTTFSKGSQYHCKTSIFLLASHHRSQLLNLRAELLHQAREISDVGRCGYMICGSCYIDGA